ncbi:Bug family tripartite tricarboxylate transporter substrate binding protein [Aquabacter spiritensis]|uniref:Tripartite-type tricarboxylate transporter receptor subunit TctC n=1 Tax=Aquabacter spiritensis TaxID=933073 RepID=A0A4V2UXC8_9HYPH|nr:tripartite tricarboxylate transporter substrate binding protein [Aquabacter spiritensis]TCT02948.1 tripartite-type tricarboxylate transporter receptor subunit TctC [Aquabacter spiritensis]
MPTDDTRKTATGSVSRRTVLALAAGALATPALIRSAHAAGYPERFVTFIVPFAPGGPTDAMARVVAGPLGELLGQTVVIENRGGAGGNIGIGAVGRATPDGYTMLLTSSAYVVNPSLYKTVPYDPFKDFLPVSNLGSSPNVFVANPQAGIKTLADLVKKAKAEPGKLSYASPGAGTTPHLAMELLKVRAGIDILHVPFSGAGPAMQAVLGNQVPLASTALPPAHPQIKAGKVIGLAETGAKRWYDLPDLPTVMESGYPDFESETFQALFTPTGTPQAVIDKMSKSVIEVLNRADVKERLNKAGFGVLAQGPAELAALVQKEVPMWREIIKTSGISAD